MSRGRLYTLCTIHSSYPTSDLGEAGVTGSRYCGCGEAVGSTPCSGCSSEYWESYPEAGGNVAGIGRDDAASLGCASVTVRSLIGTGIVT